MQGILKHQNRYWTTPGRRFVNFADTLTFTVLFCCVAINAPQTLLVWLKKSAASTFFPRPYLASVEKWEAASHEFGFGWGRREAMVEKLHSADFCAMTGQLWERSAVAPVAQPPRGQHAVWNPFHQTCLCLCALSDPVLCCTSRSHAQPQLAAKP